ncbi:MAG: LytTR family DNA-binding domain-containing protein [Prevotellaceae bacterium]|jgi:two-component system LytT family response regulator|nr:LytTR family DNA-binding domain-containing protein [Prevotellaceae bacterium]
MTVLIVDDEAPARDIIRHYLKEYAEVSLIGEVSNGFDALKIIKDKKPQLIFLDVQMPKLTGFELLELVEQPPLVIFSTAYDQFALRAFEQNAVDYLLKPYSRQRFDAALQKALAKARSGEAPAVNLQALQASAGALTRVAVKDRQQIHVIPLHSIRYIEADGDYVQLHTEKGVFLKEKTMKYFEENFPPQQFIRIHRSFIVNVDMVAKIELYEKESYRVHLKSGEALKASSSGYKALKEAVRW